MYLSGPDFLLFYGLFFFAVMLVKHCYCRNQEVDPPPPAPLDDPYLMACLRGGPNEVVYTATVSLIDRGLLTITDRIVTRSSAEGWESVSRPIEKAVVEFFEDPVDLFAVVKQPDVLEVATQYETELRRLKLIPDSTIHQTRRTIAYSAGALLFAVGVGTLMVALNTGQSKIGFLIPMMVFALIAVRVTSFPYRTVTGDKYLSNMRTLSLGLRERVKSIEPGTGSRDVLWSLSLFGVSVLPASAFPLVQYFKGGTSGGGGGCANCGSSCGGGDGGGGGCGGCGGGCGGGGGD
jgi:uncharacterized protein (TIGR04222 family)